MLASSAEGIAAPTITSSNAVASKGWRASSGRPAATARSEPVKGPSPFFALQERGARPVDYIDAAALRPLLPFSSARPRGQVVSGSRRP